VKMAMERLRFLKELRGLFSEVEGRAPTHEEEEEAWAEEKVKSGSRKELETALSELKVQQLLVQNLELEKRNEQLNPATCPVGGGREFTSAHATILGSLHVPVYLWLFDSKSIAWANECASRLWDKSSPEELVNTDLSDMSDAAATRLDNFKKRMLSDPDATFTEDWTLRPGGKPVSFVALLSFMRFEGQDGMLVEGQYLVLDSLLKSTLRLVEAVRHVGVCVTIAEESGHVLEQNPEAMRCYEGGQTTDVWSRFANDDDRIRARASIAIGRSFQGEVDTATATGIRIHSIELRIVEDAVTTKPVILMHEMDLTRVRRAENNARQALIEKEGAMHAMRLKSQFIGRMSRELRAPLEGGVVSSINELLSSTLDRRQRELAEVIRNSAELLRSLVNTACTAEIGGNDDDRGRACGSSGSWLSAAEVRSARIVKGDVLGQGSYGTVFLGVDANTGEFYAVKESMLVEDSEIDDIRHELEIMACLHHPNIVRYVGAWSDHHMRSVNVVQEYVAGGSLERHVQQFGPVAEQRAAEYVRQALLGLSYLHANGVLHRDIKPSNILLSLSGQVKLCDFGSVRKLGTGLTCTGEVKSIRGTPAYMAPEVVSNASSRKSDVWSLGATVLFLVTAVAPWRKNRKFENSVQLLFHIASTNDTPAFDAADFSEPLTQFFNSCFKRETKERPTAEMLITHPWLTQELCTPRTDQTPPNSDFLPWTPDICDRLVETWNPGQKRGVTSHSGDDLDSAQSLEEWQRNHGTGRSKSAPARCCREATLPVSPHLIIPRTAPTHDIGSMWAETPNIRSRKGAASPSFKESAPAWDEIGPIKIRIRRGPPTTAGSPGQAAGSWISGDSPQIRVNPTNQRFWDSSSPVLQRKMERFSPSVWNSPRQFLPWEFESPRPGLGVGTPGMRFPQTPTSTGAAPWGDMSPHIASSPRWDKQKQPSSGKGIALSPGTAHISYWGSSTGSAPTNAAPPTAPPTSPLWLLTPKPYVGRSSRSKPGGDVLATVAAAAAAAAGGVLEYDGRVKREAEVFKTISLDGLGAGLGVRLKQPDAEAFNRSPYDVHHAQRSGDGPSEWRPPSSPGRTGGAPPRSPRDLPPRSPRGPTGPPSQSPRVTPSQSPQRVNPSQSPQRVNPYTRATGITMTYEDSQACLNATAAGRRSPDLGGRVYLGLLPASQRPTLDTSPERVRNHGAEGPSDMDRFSHAAPSTPAPRTPTDFPEPASCRSAGSDAFSSDSIDSRLHMP